MTKKHDENENVIINDDINNMKEGDKEKNEENNRYVVEGEVDNKVASNITLRNDYFLIFQDGDISNEKGMFITNNTRSNENLETSKKESDSSLYSYNRKYNQSVRTDASANINKTNIVYHAMKDRLIALADIYKVISEKSYNKQAMNSNLNIPLEEHNDNIKAKRDENENVIINDVSSNINKGNEKINENNKRDVGDAEVDTKVVSNIESGNNYLLSDEITLNDNVIILNEGDLSNEKGTCINNNKILMRISKQTKKQGIFRYTQIIETILKQLAKMQAQDQTKQIQFIIKRKKD